MWASLCSLPLALCSGSVLCSALCLSCVRACSVSLPASSLSSTFPSHHLCNHPAGPLSLTRRPTSVSSVCPAENLIPRSSLPSWPARHASLRSQPDQAPCARRSKAHNQPTRLKPILRPTKHIAIRRDGLPCPRRHGSPPAILPTRRTTIPQPPPRVFKFEFPTAISHVERPAAYPNTIRRSLLAPTRSVSARASWKKRKSRTRSSWMATSTRYVKEHVTQEQDWQEDTSCRWEPCRRAVPANGISRLASCSGSTLRLGYLNQPRCHATAVHTQGQMLRTEDRRLRVRARASVCGRHGYTVSVHRSCRRHTPV
jgi:hypothetical protein